VLVIVIAVFISISEIYSGSFAGWYFIYLRLFSNRLNDCTPRKPYSIFSLIFLLLTGLCFLILAGDVSGPPSTGHPSVIQT
jgi:hypothetical protein